MKYGIVIFPAKKLQDLANSYRKRYDPHYALIPPHLTLKGAFEATDEQAESLSDRLHKAAENARPFNMKVNKFSSFQPVNNVIYLKVEPDDYLDALHTEINQIFPGGENQEYAFVPHITVGQKLSDDEHSDVFGSLRMERINYEETIDRFHLLYQLENGSWTVYETFRFGKES